MLINVYSQLNEVLALIDYAFDGLDLSFALYPFNELFTDLTIRVGILNGIMRRVRNIAMAYPKYTAIISSTNKKLIQNITYNLLKIKLYISNEQGLVRLVLLIDK